MKFCTDASGPQRMNPKDIGDPLIFHLIISMLTFEAVIVDMINMIPA